MDPRKLPFSFLVPTTPPPGDRPPAPPSGLKATNITSDSVVLRWDPTDGALYYVIKYGRLDIRKALRDTAQNQLIDRCWS